MGTRRLFSPDFKFEVVRLIKEREVSVVQAAQDQDVHENVCARETHAIAVSLGPGQPIHQRALTGVAA